MTAADRAELLDLADLQLWSLQVLDDREFSAFAEHPAHRVAVTRTLAFARDAVHKLAAEAGHMLPARRPDTTGGPGPIHPSGRASGLAAPSVASGACGSAGDPNASAGGGRAGVAPDPGAVPFTLPVTPRFSMTEGEHRLVGRVS